MQIYLLWVILDAWLRLSSCAERVPALVGCARTEAFSHILKAAREWLAPGETPQGGGETAWPQASRRARARPHRTRGGPAAEREIRAGRPGDAWALLPGLPFSAALGVVSRLDAVGWSPPDPAGTVLRRVRPAARLPAGSLDAILSGVPSLLGAIPGSPPVSALSFAPDAPALAVTGYEHGLEVWSVRPLSLLRRYGSPDAEAGPFGPAPPTLVRTRYSPVLSVEQAAFLPGGRVLTVSGRITGPYRDVHLAEGDSLRALARLPDEPAALLPAGGRAIAVTQHGQVWMLGDDDVRQDAALDLDGEEIPLWGAASSPDGDIIAVYSHRSAGVFDRRSGRALARTGPLPPLRAEVVTLRPTALLPGLVLSTDAGRIASIAFQPDGTGLIAGTVDGAVRLLDLDFRHQGEMLPHQFYPAVLTSAASKVAVTAKDGLVRVYRWGGVRRGRGAVRRRTARGRHSAFRHRAAARYRPGPASLPRP